MNKIDVTNAVVGESSRVPKLLVISSYRRPCGIAQYLEFLEGPLRRLPVDVEIAPLPVDLLRGSTSFARRAAAIEIASIVEKARRADVVSVQFEPGLFGLTPFAIWTRLRRLFDASRRVIITYHTAPPMNERFGSGFRSARARLSLLRAQFVFNRLLAHVRRNPQKFHHIVHTRREAQRFQLLGVSPESITTIPLSFLDDFTRGSVDLTAAKAKLIERWNIPPEAKVIGTFGFLSEYKGIEVAIRSLRHLPKDYHLMIVGGLHPEDIALRTIEQPYLRRLLAEISNDDPAGIPSAPSSNEVRAGRPHRRANKDLARRIHFCGSPGNQEFNQLLAGCDIVVLPYAEVGQTSSGPAALALDMQLPLICSRTNCFRELDRFEPGILSFFEIGNHIELAQRIALGDPFYPERVQARSRYVLRFNVELRAAAYLAACKRLSASVV